MVTAAGQLESALKGWLNSPRVNMLITVSLKQALPTRWKDSIHWVRLTRDETARAARIVRDRAAKKINRQGYRAGNWPFLVFIHEDSERLHLHILAERPPTMEPADFRSRFEHAVRSKVVWVYDHIHYSDIGDNPSARETVLGYGLKGGLCLENFVPEASFVG
ncbi:MAG TPA: hypothetical protein VIU82_20030 [Bosea sp. (in: a-proteobacteria)]